MTSAVTSLATGARILSDLPAATTARASCVMTLCCLATGGRAITCLRAARAHLLQDDGPRVTAAVVAEEAGVFRGGWRSKGLQTNQMVIESFS